MKLYMKQKVFSITGKFSVKDELGNDKYFVVGKIISWGRNYHIYNENHQEMAFIKQKVLTFRPKFLIYNKGEIAAKIVRKWTIRPEYEIQGNGWEVIGDYLTHDYKICKNGKTIVSVRKEWVSFGDCYVLDIDDRERANEAMVVAVVIALEVVYDLKRDALLTEAMEH